MIRSFSCKNFRNVNVDGLTFKKINVLVGPNNSGKSNFIKALTFYSDILNNDKRGNFKTAFLNTVSKHGWEHVYNKTAKVGEPIQFSWDIDVDDWSVRYKFSYTVGQDIKDYNIVLEALESCNRNGNIRPFNYFSCHQDGRGVGYFSTATKLGKPNTRLRFELDSQEILSIQFKDILLKDSEIYADDQIRVDVAKVLYDLERFFRRFFVYVGMPFDLQKLRELKNIKNLDDRLSADAANFVNVFSKYKADNLVWKSRFEKKMKDLIPNLETADVIHVRDQSAFAMVINGRQYDLSDVSDGTIKGLIMNILLNVPYEYKPSLLALDEPEANLHPAWQKVVGNWLQTSGNFDQIFISTHSPDFLDTFTEGFKHGQVGVFVFDAENQETIKNIEYQEIADELGKWELGDLYRTNDPALGGWPW